MDFIILETELVLNLKGHIPIILGRLFLATANTEINYQNGLMKLSFENMTIELNIFNLNQESIQHANINVIQDEIYESIDISDEEIDLESSVWLNHESEDIDEIPVDHKISQRWEPQIEPLMEMAIPSSKPSIEEVSKLGLKLLSKKFDLEIKDKKGVENIVADYLSQIIGAPSSELSVNKFFSDEQFMFVFTDLWYASHWTI